MPSTWPNAPPSASGANEGEDGGADETGSHGAKVYAPASIPTYFTRAMPR